MARKKKRMDKGVLEFVSVKTRKNVKMLIRDLGLEIVSISKIAPETIRG